MASESDWRPIIDSAISRDELPDVFGGDPLKLRVRVVANPSDILLIAHLDLHLDLSRNLRLDSRTDP